MRNFSILLFIFLIACQPKQKKQSVLTDTKIVDRVNVEEPPKEEIESSKIRTCDFGDGLFDFGVNLTKKTLAKQVSYDWITSCEAINIFQEIKRGIIKRKSLAKKIGISEDELILEYKPLKGYSNRAFIILGKKIKVGFDICDVYTCAQTTTGTGYFRGEIRIALIDTKLKKIINTIEVYTPHWEGEEGNCFTVPFSIANKKYRTVIGGLKYHVKGGSETKDGKAEVLYLDDYTGNGKKLEFTLYKQLGCVTCLSTLFGYDDKTDSLINYKIVLKEVDLDSAQKKPVKSERLWVSDMFTLNHKNGIYDFAKDHRGRNGQLHYYIVKFDRERKLFTGTLKSTSQENDTLGMSYITYPIQR